MQNPIKKILDKITPYFLPQIPKAVLLDLFQTIKEQVDFENIIKKA